MELRIANGIPQASLPPNVDSVRFEVNPAAGAFELVCEQIAHALAEGYERYYRYTAHLLGEPPQMLRTITSDSASFFVYASLMTWGEPSLAQLTADLLGGMPYFGRIIAPEIRVEVARSYGAQPKEVHTYSYCPGASYANVTHMLVKGLQGVVGAYYHNQGLSGEVVRVRAVTTSDDSYVRVVASPRYLDDIGCSVQHWLAVSGYNALLAST